MRFASLIFVAAAASAGFAAESSPKAQPAIRVEPLVSPAGAGARGASLVTSPDGVAWLVWSEPAGQETALRCATFDAAAKTWSAPRTIARGTNWFTGSNADAPALTLGEGGRATALWHVTNPPSAATAHLHHGAGYHTMMSQTADGGRTWTAATPLTRESDMVEFVSLATLADGRVLATWLDGRAKKNAPAHAHGSPGPTTLLYARIIGNQDPDTLVDPSVCDCCQTTLTAFPDGSALIAYRGRSTEEVRDIRIARFDGRAWESSRPLNHDGWKIAGCPVNGPQLATDGGRVAAAWFTAAENDPRVLASFSPDAGGRFLTPLRLDPGTGKTAGRVDTLLLRDGAILVTWAGMDGALWLRRVSPDFTSSEPTAIVRAGPGRLKSLVRTALVRDYQGGKTSATLLATFTQEGDEPGVRTLLVTVPEGELLEAEKNCDCAPASEELLGLPIRGTFAERATSSGTVRVQHPALPGVFAAGTHEFKIPPEIVAGAQPGRSFLGRIERRDGAWWLFDVRFIAAPGQ